MSVRVIKKKNFYWERTFHVRCHVKDCSPIHTIPLIRGTINCFRTKCWQEFRLRLFCKKLQTFLNVSFHLQLLFVIVLVLYSAIVRQCVAFPTLTIYLSPGVKCDTWSWVIEAMRGSQRCFMSSWLAMKTQQNKSDLQIYSFILRATPNSNIITMPQRMQ